MKTYLIYILLGLVCCVDSVGQNTIERVRIDFETSDGFARQLLLGFIPNNNTTEAFDQGYDVRNTQAYPDDFSWMIDGNRYLIQAVGQFDSAKKYPIGFFLSKTGTIKITLNSLENFDNDIAVYIYDAQTDEYSLINEDIMSLALSSGDYIDRFFIAFEAGNIMDSEVELSETDASSIDIKYHPGTETLFLQASESTQLIALDIYDVIGQKLSSIDQINDTLLATHFSRNQRTVLLLKITTTSGVLTKRIVL